MYCANDRDLGPLDISGWFEDGDGISVSSSYYVPESQGRPGQTKRVFMNVAPKVAIAIFRREVGKRKLRVVQPDQFVEMFEREYEADAGYRIEHTSSGG